MDYLGMRYGVLEHYTFLHRERKERNGRNLHMHVSIPQHYHAWKQLLSTLTANNFRKNISRNTIVEGFYIFINLLKYIYLL